MRTSSIFFVIAAMGAIATTSCVDLEPDPTADFKESMTAEVNAVPFEATDISMSFSTGNLLTITGKAADSTKIIFQLEKVIKIGTFEFSNGRDNEALYLNDLNQSYSSKRTLLGSIEITQLNQVTVQGTFEFEARNNALGTVVVTNGVFAAARE